MGTLKLGPHGCGGLNENSPHRLKYLNTLLSVGVSVGEELGVAFVLLEMAFEISEVRECLSFSLFLCLMHVDQDQSLCVCLPPAMLPTMMLMDYPLKL